MNIGYNNLSRVSNPSTPNYSDEPKGESKFPILPPEILSNLDRNITDMKNKRLYTPNEKLLKLNFDIKNLEYSKLSSFYQSLKNKVKELNVKGERSDNEIEILSSQITNSTQACEQASLKIIELSSQLLSSNEYSSNLKNDYVNLEERYQLLEQQGVQLLYELVNSQSLVQLFDKELKSNEDLVKIKEEKIVNLESNLQFLDNELKTHEDMLKVKNVVICNLESALGETNGMVVNMSKQFKRKLESIESEMIQSNNEFKKAKLDFEQRENENNCTIAELNNEVNDLNDIVSNSNNIIIEKDQIIKEQKIKLNDFALLQKKFDEVMLEKEQDAERHRKEIEESRVQINNSNSEVDFLKQKIFEMTRQSYNNSLVIQEIQTVCQKFSFDNKNSL